MIDNCRCDVIWLDFGEMRQMVDAPGKDRGARQVVRLDPGYVRNGLAADTESSPIGDPLGFLVDMLIKD